LRSYIPRSHCPVLHGGLEISDDNVCSIHCDNGSHCSFKLGGLVSIDLRVLLLLYTRRFGVWRCYGQLTLGLTTALHTAVWCLALLWSTDLRADHFFTKRFSAWSRLCQFNLPFLSSHCLLFIHGCVLSVTAEARTMVLRTHFTYFFTTVV